MNKKAIFTIVSKNYISYARVLMKSFLTHHTDCDCFVLLVDKIDGHFDPSKEPFRIIEIGQLDVPDKDSFIFKYNIMELNTAIKPFFIDYLFRKYNYHSVIYFDPDIMIFRNLQELFELLDNYSIVITPHFTSPIPDDGKKQSEIEIMRAGCYNLGFIGLSQHEKISGFLKWWQERLHKYCYSAPERGLFVDQKWIDLVPSLYDGVHILKHPGYNAAYWNLHERSFQRANDEYTINEKPLFFYHFSGINFNNIKIISKYQDRYKLSDIKHLAELFDDYKERVLREGYRDTKHWPFFYGYFDNGVKIPDVAKRLYSDHPDQRSFGNPFETAKKTSYYNWLNAAVSGRSPMTNLMMYVYSIRPDLQNAFPRVMNEDLDGFMSWTLSGLPKEYGIDKIFLKSRRNKGETADLSERVRSSKMKVSVKALLWRYGKPNASLIKSIPVIGEMAKKIHTKLAKERGAWSASNSPVNISPQYKPILATSLEDRSHNHEMGINIAGYIDTESGVGEAARGLIKGIERANIKFVLKNIEQPWLRRNDTTYRHFSKENPYPINLIHVNADQVTYVFGQLGEKYFSGKYNIGYWFWELSNFPEKWFDSFKYFDEIWVASDFLLDAISRVSPIPVVKIPVSISFKPKEVLTREALGMPPDNFVFLNMFDARSFTERKNPFALIEAFKIFYADHGCRNSLLVLKISNSETNPQLLQNIRSAIRDLPVMVINDYYDRGQIYDLLSICDVYVSLHKSEGLGLPLAEAMYLGKPVMATAYSGNMDFMNINNSFLVKYRLVEIQNDIGPYEKGSLWAEPDLLHAAEVMSYIYNHRTVASAIGAFAAAHIRTQYSPLTIGNLIQKRLSIT